MSVGLFHSMPENFATNNTNYIEENYSPKNTSRLGSSSQAEIISIFSFLKNMSMETATAQPVKNIPVSTNTKLEEIFRIYDAQKKNGQSVKNSSAKQRKEKLKKLIATVNEMRRQIEDAVYADLRKPKVETGYAELYNVVAECKHAIANLDDWMAPHEVDTPLLFVGSSSKIVSEPKGMALLLTPWNYPFQMPVQHLVAAVAAGCTVIIKPSEFTSASTLEYAALTKEAGFPDGVFNVVQGFGKEAGAALVAHPGISRISFTGSVPTAKVIAKAAADNLTPVSFELGGKSPCVVLEDADIDLAVELSSSISSTLIAIISLP